MSSADELSSDEIENPLLVSGNSSGQERWRGVEHQTAASAGSNDSSKYGTSLQPMAKFSGDPHDGEELDSDSEELFRQTLLIFGKHLTFFPWLVQYFPTTSDERFCEFINESCLRLQGLEGAIEGSNETLCRFSTAEGSTTLPFSPVFLASDLVREFKTTMPLPWNSVWGQRQSTL